jgi:hypothetical protein
MKGVRADPRYCPEHGTLFSTLDLAQQHWVGEHGGARPSQQEEKRSRVSQAPVSDARAVAMGEPPAEGLVFAMPLPPNFGNARPSHWSVRYRTQQQFWRALDALVTAGLLPRPPAVPYARAAMTVVLRPHGKLQDTTNAEARCKQVEDWLVSRGYLCADDPAHLRRGPVAQVQGRPPGLTVTLLPWDAGNLASSNDLLNPAP